MSQGQVKGTIMTEVVKYLRHRKAEARALVPPRLHHYLEMRVLSTSWHPEEDYLELMRVIVQLRRDRPEPGVSAWEASARASTRSYFEGPYKSLVRGGDPLRTLANIQALWRLRHDTGEMTVESEGAKSARIELSDYGLVAAEACELIQGTIWGFLHYAGAQDIEVRHVQCRARGSEVEEWQASWS
jgi:uncharacterized protein (TIGR02265 family)